MQRFSRRFNSKLEPLIVAGIVVAIIALLGVLCWVAVSLTVWTWNVLIHETFGGPMIEWYQAVAFLVLTSIVGGYFKRSRG